MNTLTLIHSVGSIGAFANRAFLPAFLTALFLRFAPEIWGIQHLEIARQAADHPTWFTHDITLSVLGILAFLEICLSKSAAWREFTADSQHWIQTAVALGTTFGLMSTTDAQFASQAIPVISGGIGQFALPIIVALGTLFLASLLSRVERGLISVDPDDVFSLGKIFSWTRDLSALGLVLTALIIPVLAILLVFVLLGLLALIAAVMSRSEARRRSICESCHGAVHSCAPYCPHCDAKRTQVLGLNWLGFTSAKPAGPSHGFQLLAAQRCPHCAEILHRQRVPTQCQHCHHQALSTQAEIDDYLATISRRVPFVAAVALACSFLPAIGFAISFITNRLAIARPLRSHTPRGRRTAARIGLRLLTLVALAFHWVPFFGQLILPLLTWATWRVHRHAFPADHSQWDRKRIKSNDEPTPLPAIEG